MVETVVPARGRRSGGTVPSRSVPDAVPDTVPGGLARSAADERPDPAVPATTDAALVAAVVARDPRALDQLYGRYGRPSYALARRVCADDGLAEDVVQEVFLALWRDPTRFDPARGGVASWLLTLVHHKSVDAVRREATRRRHHPTTDAPDEQTDTTHGHGPSADRAALGSVIAEQVRAALGRLPREQRQALGLAYYGGYTQREVASLTGVPIGTVKSRMFAGVARLRVLLGPILGPLDALADLA